MQQGVQCESLLYYEATLSETDRDQSVTVNVTTNRIFQTDCIYNCSTTFTLISSSAYQVALFAINSVGTRSSTLQSSLGENQTTE